MKTAETFGSLNPPIPRDAARATFLTLPSSFLLVHQFLGVEYIEEIEPNISVSHLTHFAKRPTSTRVKACYTATVFYDGV